MGFVESWHICVYNLCWNSPKFRGAYFKSKVRKLGRMDTGTSQGNQFMVFLKIMSTITF